MIPSYPGAIGLPKKLIDQQSLLELVVVHACATACATSFRFVSVNGFSRKLLNVVVPGSVLATEFPDDEPTIRSTLNNPVWLGSSAGKSARSSGDSSSRSPSPQP